MIIRTDMKDPREYVKSIWDAYDIKWLGVRLEVEEVEDVLEGIERKYDFRFDTHQGLPCRAELFFICKVLQAHGIEYELSHHGYDDEDEDIDNDKKVADLFLPGWRNFS